MAGEVKRLDITEAMKVIFEDPVHVQVVEDSEFLDFIEQDVNVKYETTTGGRYVELSHEFRLGGAAGMRSEGDYIPQSGKPKFKNSRIKLRKAQGIVEMTGDVMRRVKNDEGAFLDYMERSLPNCVTRLLNSLDRQWIGTGFGIKARVATKGADYITVEDSLGVDGYTEAWKQFLEGDHIVFGTDATGATLRAGAVYRFAVVSDIDEGLNKLTLVNIADAAVDATLLANIVVGDYIFEGDNAGASVQDPADSEYREISGMLAGVDNGDIVSTYHNIPRAGQRLWQGIVIDAADPDLDFGGLTTEDILVYADEQVAERGNGRIDAIVTSRSANRGYWKSLKGDRQFVDPRGSYEGGKAGEKRKGLPVILGDRVVNLRVARKLPPEVLFGLEKGSWKRWGLGKFEWDDATGAIWNRASDGTGRLDQFYAVGNMYEEGGCLFPRHNFRIENLSPVN